MKRATTAIVPLFLGAAAISLAQQYTISTYAGGGPQPPTLGIGFISSITTDGTGNVYFSSAYNSCTCVFKLDPSGNGTRIAGGKKAGFSGDGGPATQALLNDPVGLAVDSAGNLFIAEGALYDVYGGQNFIITPQGGFHERIRKVSPNGIITTVAGGGVQGFSGDGGPATSASFFGLSGIAVDAAGNLYIADGLYDDGWDAPFGNNRIRKVTPDGTITTVAGIGDQGFSGDGGPGVNAQLNGPWGLTVDSSGNLFFSDFYNSRIRELSIDGTISTVVDLDSQVPNCVSTSNSYQFCSPNSTALDPSGNLVFSNCYCGSFPAYVVLKQSPNGAVATVLATNITLEIGLIGPIAIDAGGNLWFSEDSPGPGPGLRKVSPDGTLTTVVGGGACCGGDDGGPATSAVLQHVNGVAADTSGNLFIADVNNRRIRDVMPGGIITTVAGSGSLNVNCDALTAGTFSPATATELCLPSQVAVDGSGNIYIVDRNRIRKVTPDGTITSIAGDGTIGFSSDGAIAAQAQLAYPNSIAVDSAGNIYFAEWSRVRKITPDGIVTTVAGTTARAGNNNGCSPPASPACGPPPVGDGQQATSVQLFGPASAVVDSNGNLYFVDGPRIRRVTPDGIISTAAGNGGRAGYQLPTGDGGLAVNAGLWSPNGVTVDGAGNLYISEPVRIRKVTTDGIINTIAGTQDPGYSGDGGPATQAQLWNPTGLTVDGAGNVYFADSFNNVIRVLKPVR
jgi:sugar lactone lactonase YvrE